MAEERFEGYRDALSRKKIKVDPAYIVSTDLSAAGTRAAMEELLNLKKRPTAIIAFNDYVALDAMKYAKGKDIKLDEDISFVSFANLPICHYMENPPLASVEQFPFEQGNKAAEILWQLLDAESAEPALPLNQVMLDSKLVVHDQEEQVEA